MLRRSISLMCSWVFVALVGCGGVPSKVGEDGEIKKVIEMKSSSDFIETIGIGAADQNLSNITQRRSLSREAAKVMAQHEMFSYVKGLQLTGGITVERAIETDSQLGTKIETLIEGAEIIRTEWTNDDGAVVTLRLERKRLDKILKNHQ